MDFQDLSPEQQEKVKACNRGWTRTTSCSKCKSENIVPTGEFDLEKGTVYKCNDCGALSYAYNA